MNPYEILTMALGVGMSALGWFARQLWGDVKGLTSIVSQLKESLPKEYVMKDDFIAFKSDLFELLHRIENKLDGKQDK